MLRAKLFLSALAGNELVTRARDIYSYYDILTMDEKYDLSWLFSVSNTSNEKSSHANTGFRCAKDTGSPSTENVTPTVP